MRDLLSACQALIVLILVLLNLPPTPPLAFVTGFLVAGALGIFALQYLEIEVLRGADSGLGTKPSGADLFSGLWGTYLDGSGPVDPDAEPEPPGLDRRP